jgi:hypothetical protein
MVELMLVGANVLTRPLKREILVKYDTLKIANGARDARHHDVAAIRRGDAEDIMPGFFPRSWPKQVIANTIDLASTDLGEMVGMLPTFQCRPARTTVRSSIEAAEKRTKIVNGYVAKSRLQKYMYSGADGYFSFGFMVFVVEPDFEHSCPVIRIDQPQGAYYELDFFGNVKCYFKRWIETAESLIAKFPDLESRLIDSFSKRAVDGAQMIEVVKYYGKDYTCVFLPTVDDGHFVREAPNLTGRVPVFVAERPRWDGEIRGQFDQALFVQLARAKMGLHMLDITDQAVNAPTILPTDITKFPTGPRAIVRTNNPTGAGKMKIEVPPQVFAANENLRGEERIAARYPEGRTGNIDASVITGEGVEALLGTMSSQISTAQAQIKDAASDALAYSLMMDELYWPDVQKTSEGYYENQGFSLRYTPSSDIKGEYGVEATYGMLTGMDFNRALVAMLQMRGDKLVSRALVRRHLPQGMGGIEVDAEVDIEDLTDALKQGVFGMAGAIPQLAAAGQDPTQLVNQIARMIDFRRAGKPMDEAIQKALEPTEEEKAAAEAAAQAQATANPLGAALGEAGAATPGGGNPVTPGVSPGGNEGMGSIQQLLAGLTSAGEPTLSSRVARSLPA